jgi:hypothetical protein
VIRETNANRAKALCAILNSVIFLANFFLLKQESTGRYIDIRFYDLEEMLLYPTDESVGSLVRVFDQYNNTPFPALIYQFDKNFDARYDEFCERANPSNQQQRLSVLDTPISPAPERLSFDLAVCEALGVSVSEDELKRLYSIFVDEMMLIKQLARD